MIQAIADALDTLLSDLPFVFFGHSMGALDRLRAGAGAAPARPDRSRCTSSSPAAARRSCRPARSRSTTLPEPEFIAKLRELNGTPEEVLQHEELMKLIIPILRADFSVNETYEYAEEEPLDAGISAFGGLGDEEVTREDVEAWKQHTRGRFRMRMLPGDHFFINSGKDLILESLARDLAELSTAHAPRAR